MTANLSRNDRGGWETDGPASAAFPVTPTRVGYIGYIEAIPDYSEHVKSHGPYHLISPPEEILAADEHGWGGSLCH